MLLLEEDEERRSQGVVKCLKALDNYLSGYTPDGGWNEGPPLLECGGSLIVRLPGAGV
ncbi:hypothetical protein [Paenibacillus sp. HB172176]|uniref:hypothetical protein n=1 Tax=Paenibacillus sp. HB172176 TaxID=2493690 RepID=UPI001438D0FA|nr:hypothetical protein [Paenibacillus sp. HB172176]